MVIQLSHSLTQCPRTIIEMSPKLLIFCSFLGIAFGGQCHLRGICDKATNAPCIVEEIDDDDIEPRTLNRSQLTLNEMVTFEKLCQNYKVSQELCCDHENVEFLLETLEGEMNPGSGAVHLVTTT